MKVGTYAAAQSGGPNEPRLLVRASRIENCAGEGTGTMTINALEIYGRKQVGAFLRYGYMNANFTWACGSTEVTGTIEISEDAITSDDQLLSPDDADGGGGDDGGDDGGDGGGDSAPPPPPPPDASVTFPQTILEQAVAMTNDSTATVPLTVATHNAFVGDVQLDVFSDAPENAGLEVSLSKNFFPSPGTGAADVTVKVGRDTLPRDYKVTVLTTANGKFGFNTFTVSVLCDPPMILGIDQPRAATFSGSGSTTIGTKAIGSGPFSYQWYSGSRGSTDFPVANGTDATLTTNTEGLYWVRVSNACGSVDSAAAFVSRQ
jgi:hypothetical protein